jgi:hypothetical protein
MKGGSVTSTSAWVFDFSFDSDDALVGQGRQRRGGEQQCGQCEFRFHGISFA